MGAVVRKLQQREARSKRKTSLASKKKRRNKTVEYQSRIAGVEACFSTPIYEDVPLQTTSLSSIHIDHLNGIQCELQSWYTEVMTRFRPLLRTDVKLDLDGIYTNLENVPRRKTQQTTGLKYDEIPTLSSIFNTSASERIVCFIEGPAGMGKSTLCKQLVYLWSKNDFSIVSHSFDVTFLLDSHMLTGNFKKCIKKHIFPNDSDLLADNIYEYLRNNQKKCLLIIDGVDELTPDGKDTVLGLLREEELPHINLVLTGRPEASKEFVKYVKLHFKLKGFSLANVQAYICKHFGSDDNNVHEKLLNTLETDRTLREIMANPFITLLVCLLLEENERDIPAQSTEILNQVLQAICKKYVIGKEVSESVGLTEQNLFLAAGLLAYNGLNQGIDFYTEKNLASLCPNGFSEHLLKSGLLNKGTTVCRRHAEDVYSFPHKSFQEFLCTKYLAELSVHELKDKLRSFPISRSPYLSTVTILDHLGYIELHYDEEKLALISHRFLTLRDKSGFTVLHHAVSTGNNAATEEILVRCPEVADNRNYNGDTALHLACLQGYKDVTCTLITLGKADSDIKNIQQQTPLLLAEEKGHTSLIEPLLKGKGKDMLGGSWDRAGCFHSPGGTLEKDGSSVKLIIPHNAVEGKSAAYISGKVFTDLKEFTTVFQLSEQERFASPIVEFEEHSYIEFSLHLIIEMPTANMNLSDGGFRVLHRSKDHKVNEVPANTSEGNKPDVYYELLDGHIRIFTKHFCEFCVTCDSKISGIHAVLCGSRLQNKGDSCEVRIRLYIYDSLYSIEDFKTDQYLEHQMEKNGLKHWYLKTFSIYNHRTRETISSSISLYKVSKRDWKIKARPDGSRLFVTREEMLCTFQEQRNPVLLGQWIICSKTDGLSQYAMPECCIDVLRKHDEVCESFVVTNYTTGHTQGQSQEQAREQNENSEDSKKRMQMHKTLYQIIGDHLPQKSPDFLRFKQAMPLLPRDREDNNGTAEALLTIWESRGGISLGNYGNLLMLLEDTQLIQISEEAKKQIDRINKVENGYAV